MDRVLGHEFPNSSRTGARATSQKVPGGVIVTSVWDVHTLVFGCL